VADADVYALRSCVAVWQETINDRIVGMVRSAPNHVPRGLFDLLITRSQEEACLVLKTEYIQKIRAHV
jgi:hypothetical protein